MHIIYSGLNANLYSAAIAGGLAGIHYGLAGIPEYWVVSIARMDDIMELGMALNEKYCN